jgi:hypothetical protein
MEDNIILLSIIIFIFIVYLCTLIVHYVFPSDIELTPEELYILSIEKNENIINQIEIMNINKSKKE